MLPKTLATTFALALALATSAPAAHAAPPDGAFVKGSAATIYVVHKGKKRGIPTWPTFLALGTRGVAITLPDPEIAAIPDGPAIPAGAERLPIKGTDATVYLMEKGKKRAIPTWESFLSLGFEGPEIVELPDANIAAIPSGPAIAVLPADGTFIKGSGATVYLVHQGKKRAIPTWETFMALGTKGVAAKVSDADLAHIAAGASVPVGAERLPVKGSDPTVYVMKKGKKRAIPSWDAFLAMGFQGPDIVTLPDANIALIADAPAAEL